MSDVPNTDQQTSTTESRRAIMGTLPSPLPTQSDSGIYINPNSSQVGSSSITVPLLEVPSTTIPQGRWGEGLKEGFEEHAVDTVVSTDSSTNIEEEPPKRDEAGPIKVEVISSDMFSLPVLPTSPNSPLELKDKSGKEHHNPDLDKNHVNVTGDNRGGKSSASLPQSFFKPFALPIQQSPETRPVAPKINSLLSNGSRSSSGSPFALPIVGALPTQSTSAEDSELEEGEVSDSWEPPTTEVKQSTDDEGGQTGLEEDSKDEGDDWSSNEESESDDVNRPFAIDPIAMSWMLQNGNGAHLPLQWQGMDQDRLMKRKSEADDVPYDGPEAKRVKTTKKKSKKRKKKGVTTPNLPYGASDNSSLPETDDIETEPKLQGHQRLELLFGTTVTNPILLAEAAPSSPRLQARVPTSESQKEAQVRHAAAERERKHRERAATTPCEYWASGRCFMGNHCPFSHAGEGKPYVPSERLPCRFFKSGQCVRGNECPWSHDLKLEPCVYFHARGGCAKGPSCPFSHDQLTEEQVQRLVHEEQRWSSRKRKGYGQGGEEAPRAVDWVGIYRASLGIPNTIALTPESRSSSAKSSPRQPPELPSNDSTIPATFNLFANSRVDPFQTEQPSYPKLGDPRLSSSTPPSDLPAEPRKRAFNLPPAPNLNTLFPAAVNTPPVASAPSSMIEEPTVGPTEFRIEDVDVDLLRGIPGAESVLERVSRQTPSIDLHGPSREKFGDGWERGRGRGWGRGRGFGHPRGRGRGRGRGYDGGGRGQWRGASRGGRPF
ncbi:uncharacterized protein SPPG_05537 [Spizellomyces punctatus DAOM BR117]|uniref:C3H1-type domain-containing protein n=1 Tax=Spizellomyces punctatus (strain DAOM BR117) TaxID=645134 RepID=A0A0L0HEU1_SPIPD|nr:uncharacterized protein SPPG_05537 [Spizellomyces punctatus DAOM BR117]KNC99283.1 hypothetical protein SPPG_05537 [Spizellomyces punctatus DAOM BR117]|eukprot:XP_016607323.1 hypothetical protein SPPG_05537 [Spizellomyces punctatus DAOM BR117]